MNWTSVLVFVYLLLLSTKPRSCLHVAKIVQASYTAGIAFSKINASNSAACVCACFVHPHCLSVGVTTTSLSLYSCQLYATYPTKSSQLSASTTSDVTVLINRTLSSVYLSNGTRLSNPTSLFSSASTPWIPLFKLFTGNNQPFLGLNSSNLTTVTAIPKVSTDQVLSHWFSVLLAQWNQNFYVPSQIALAFIVNSTVIIDFLVFNGTQTSTTSWFGISRLLSTQYWALSQYTSTSIAQTQMIPLYTDSDCVRSLNCNFKYSSSGCTQDFYGFFFIYGGYKDLCIAAVRNMSKVSVPSIFYSPTTAYTNGKLDFYNVSASLMGFVR